MDSKTMSSKKVQFSLSSTVFFTIKREYYDSYN